MRILGLFSVTGLIVLTSWLVGFEPQSSARPVTEAARRVDAPGAIRKSLRYLERDGIAWFEGRIPFQEGSGCVSCHHVTFAIWSHNEATRQGIEIEGSEIEELTARAVEFLLSEDKGRVVSVGQMISARAHSDEERIDGKLVDPLAKMAELITGEQEAGGWWRARGQFPTQNRSEHESDAVATMWTILALGSLGEGLASLEAPLTEAERWLAEEPEGETNESLLSRMLVLHQWGKSSAARELGLKFLEGQNEDGGFGWRADDPSIPFSTGQALFALATVDADGYRIAIDAGRRYLLSTQRENGSWSTPSRWTSDEPDEAKDYIYEYWGTAWASLGLSRSLPR